jgi:glycosyltransferase involved in cell wall biosynthesis
MAEWPVSVEILTAIDSGEWTTGRKRNWLLSQAVGDYVVFVDDDDEIPAYYVEELLKAHGSGADCFGINGIITTNGADEKQWFISKDYEYKAEQRDGREVYLRYPNHITPIKRKIALLAEFPDVSHGEDYEWATKIRKTGKIKTECTIERPMYHYKFVTHKPLLHVQPE